MRQKHPFTFFGFLIFFLLQANIYFAQDSLFSFKFGVGISYNQFRTTGNSYTNQSSHFSTNLNLRKYKDTISFSPALKLALYMKISKQFQIGIGVNYNYSKLADSTYSINGSSNPSTSSSYSNAISRDNLSIANKFIIGIGPELNIHHFYIQPKFNLAFLFIYTKTTESISVVSRSGLPTFITATSNTTEAVKSKNTDFIGGGGLIVGYNFKIKQLPLFVELQSDYLGKIDFFEAKSWDSSLIVGIQF